MAMFLRAIHRVAARSAVSHTRTISTAALRRAEGDTGSIRSGGDRHADTWSRREKAAEDMYSTHTIPQNPNFPTPFALATLRADSDACCLVVKEREKEIIVLLRQRIHEQEKKLAEDRRLLDRMEDQYGHQSELSEAREAGQGRGGGTMI